MCVTESCSVRCLRNPILFDIDQQKEGGLLLLKCASPKKRCLKLEVCGMQMWQSI